jgi:hypothetical protein
VALRKDPGISIGYVLPPHSGKFLLLCCSQGVASLSWRAMGFSAVLLPGNLAVAISPEQLIRKKNTYDSKTDILSRL